jgi:hypothetical protein
LGSIVASAWVSEDQKKNKRIKSLTLLWPPFELKHAMKNFDNIVNEHRVANHNCHIINKAWLLTKEMLLKDFPDFLSKKDEKCLGSIVLIDGFMGSMKKSWEAHTQTSGINTTNPESFEDFFTRKLTRRTKLEELLTGDTEGLGEGISQYGEPD